MFIFSTLQQEETMPYFSRKAVIIFLRASSAVYTPSLPSLLFTLYSLFFTLCSLFFTLKIKSLMLRFFHAMPQKRYNFSLRLRASAVNTPLLPSLLFALCSLFFTLCRNIHLFKT